MELAMKVKSPSNPKGGIARVNPPASISNSSKFSEQSDRDENNLTQGMVKWKQINWLAKSPLNPHISPSITCNILN